MADDLQKSLSKTRRTLTRTRKKRFVPPFTTIEVDPFAPFSKALTSCVAPKGVLWIKGGRKIRLWENPMAERYAGIDRADGKLFELVKVH